MREALLSVRDLVTVIDGEDEPVPVVRGASFDLADGETAALNGESGSGKSMTMLSVIGLHPRPVEEGPTSLPEPQPAGADRGRGEAP